jgi:hypothetical protein
MTRPGFGSASPITTRPNVAPLMDDLSSHVMSRRAVQHHEGYCKSLPIASGVIARQVGSRLATTSHPAARPA